MPPIQSMAAKLTLALGVGSVLFALGVQPLALSPEAVLREFFLWQPLTYTFVSYGALGVIFSLLITYQIGGALEMSWGSKRLLWFAVGSTVLAGLLTVLLSLVVPVMRDVRFLGGTVMTSALWIGYGLSVGRGQSNFWGMPITGNGLAAIGVGFTFLNALYMGFWRAVPDFIVIALAFAYVRGFSPRIVWLRFQSWRLQRQLKGRSKHLKVVSGDRNMPSDSDRYLH